MYVCVSKDEKNLQPYFEKNNSLCKGQAGINLQDWALEEIKSAPIPETENYKKIAEHLKHKYGKENVKFIFYNP